MIKIGISFKDNEEEKKLYEYLKGQLSPSIFIKMLIKKDMEKESINHNNSKSNRFNF